MLTEAEKVQGPISPAIRAACIAVRTRQLAMAKAADAMDLGYVAQAYSDRAGKLLDGLVMVREGVGAPPPHFIQMPVSSRAVRPINSLAMRSRLSSRSSSAP